MSKTPMILTGDHRRSSVSSSCPSLASSFGSSTSTDCSDSSFPSPGTPWSGVYPSYNMKELTENAFAEPIFAGFSTADMMAINFIPASSPPCRFPGYDPGYENVSMYNIVPPNVEPSQTVHNQMMHKTSSPLSITGATIGGYDYQSDYQPFDSPIDFTKAGFGSDLKTDFKPSFSDECSSPEFIIKRENKYTLPKTQVKKERSKRSKATVQYVVERGTYECRHPGCTADNNFKRAEHLKRHTKTVHEKKFFVNCIICNKPFGRADNCRDHEKRHIHGSHGPKSGKRVEFCPDAQRRIDASYAQRKKTAGVGRGKITKSRA